MITLPTMTVPTGFKAPPALPQSGQGGGTFMDHLVSPTTPNFKPSKVLSGTTALNTSLSRKIPQRSDNGNRNASSLMRPSAKQSNQQASPSQKNTQSPTNADASQSAAANPANQSNGNTDQTTNTDTAPANGSATSAFAQIAAALGIGTTGQLGGTAATPGDQAKSLAATASNSGGANQALATSLQTTPPSATKSLNQFTLPAGLTLQDPSATGNQTTPVNQPPLPTGTDTSKQFGTPATTFASNRFGAPGATSITNQTNAPQPNAAPSQPSNDAIAALTTDPNAATTSSTAQTSGSATNTNADTTATLAGASELNARIVAGATTLTTQSSTSLASTVKELMQPRDPNAGTPTPSSATGLQPVEKSRGSANVTAATDNASANTFLQPSTKPAFDPKDFDAALNHSLGGDRDAGAELLNDNAKRVASATDNANNASAVSTTPTPPQPSLPANVPPVVPTDAAARAPLIDVPAGEQVAVHLKQAIKNGADEIQIQLKPASLGAIDVKLNVNHDGRLTAVISADRSDTLHLLKQDSSSLEQALRDAGFSADSGSLSFNLRGNADPSSQGGSQQSSAFNTVASLDAETPTKAAAYNRRQASGGVDIQV